MELTNPWWTAGLASEWATGPIKIIYSHMNITDSMRVYHWTDIRRINANIAPMNPYQPLPFQISDRVLDSEPRGCVFEPHRRYCVVPLSKTHLSLLNTGSTQEDPSRHSWKIVDCDIKNQIKQTSKSYHSTSYLMLSSKLIYVCSNIVEIVEEEKANEEVF